MPAVAGRRRRPGAGCPVLRGGDRGGRRCGASRRGAQAGSAGAAGPRCGPLFRLRAGRRRTTGRCRGRRRRGMSGWGRRPTAHRRIRRPGRPGAGPRAGCGVPVGVVRHAAGRGAQPLRAGTCRACGSSVAHGNPHPGTVRGPPSRGCRLPVRDRRGDRPSFRAGRARPRPLRTRPSPRPRRGAALRPADRPGRCGRVRRADVGRRPAPQPGGRRGGMHPVGHSRRHRRRRRSDPGVAVCRTVDRGRHRRPGAVATRRLADLPGDGRARTHRPGDLAATATGGSDLGRSAAVAAVGRPR